MKLSFVTVKLNTCAYNIESKIILFLIDSGIPIVAIKGLGVCNRLKGEHIYHAGNIEKPYHKYVTLSVVFISG